MKAILVALVALALAGGGAGAYLWVAAEGSVEEAAVAQPAPAATATPAPTPTVAPAPAPAKGQLWRWVNVTVVIPEGSDVFASEESVPSVLKPPDGGPGLRIIRDTDPSDDLASSVLIDAENGALIRDDVLPEDRTAFDQVLQTLTVAPLDLLTAPWPYNGEPPPNLPRQRFAGISFVRPTHDTGLDVYTGIGDPGGGFVGIRNGRSAATAYFDAAGGLALDTTAVLAQDRAVFQRWLATVRLCGLEIAC